MHRWSIFHPFRYVHSCFGGFVLFSVAPWVPAQFFTPGVVDCVRQASRHLKKIALVVRLVHVGAAFLVHVIEWVTRCCEDCDSSRSHYPFVFGTVRSPASLRRKSLARELFPVKTHAGHMCRARTSVCQHASFGSVRDSRSVSMTSWCWQSAVFCLFSLWISGFSPRHEVLHESFPHRKMHMPSFSVVILPKHDLHFETRVVVSVCVHRVLYGWTGSIGPRHANTCYIPDDDVPWNKSLWTCPQKQE